MGKLLVIIPANPYKAFIIARVTMNVGMPNLTLSRPLNMPAAADAANAIAMPTTTAASMLISPSFEK